MTRKKPTELEFEAHVRNKFSYLWQKYGLIEIYPKDGREPFHIIYENEKVFVSIRGTDFGAGTEIYIGEAPFKNRYSGWPLWLIIELRDPARIPKSMFEWGGQLKQATDGAKDLLELCDDLLSGDLSAKNELDIALENEERRNIEGWEKYEQELQHTRKVQQANNAFRLKNYREVVSLLESVRKLLTPAELKKLEYAKKKIVT